MCTMKCLLLIFFFSAIQWLNSDTISADTTDTGSNIAIDTSIAPVTLKSAKIVLKKDTSLIQQKSFSQEAMQKYLSSDEFNYKEDYTFTSALDKFIESLKRYFIWLLEKIFGPIEADKLFDALPSRETVLYTITFILFALILLFFYRTKLRFLFYKKSKKNSSTNFLEENIHEIDFVNEIYNAEEEKKYRLAIRLHFLALLKSLDTNEYIQWQTHKTNREYLSELSDETFRKSFEEIVSIFEYVWYGEFVPNETQYNKSISTFVELQRLLSTTKVKVL
jgi:hypothetical protein